MSDRALRATIAALALLGLAIAGYLTYVHYGDAAPLCVAQAACEKVQTSAYAEFAGIPVALLGAIGYALILMSLLLPGDLGRLSAAGLAFGGFAFSAYLTYHELFTIDAICPWCVASAVVMTTLLALTAWRVVRADDLLAGDLTTGS